jgi:hypothetical protein
MANDDGININEEGVKAVLQEAATDIARRTQPAIDQLAAESNGDPISVIVPKLEAILGANALDVPPDGVLKMAKILATGETVQLVPTDGS